MNAALIGLGRMGLRHLQVLRELGLEVVGAADLMASARAKAAADQGLAPERLFADPAAMIDQLRAELVVIATTAPSHADLVCRAAAAGARVILCEKPMAVSLAECDRMIAACAAAGTRLAINHQMRFMEQYTMPRGIVTDESFGGLGSMTVVAGNFGMAMNASHYFEAFRFMAGEMPATVAAWFSPATLANPRGPQFEDRAGCIRLTTASGRRFYLDASTDQGHGMHVTYAGPHGRLDVDELAGQARLVLRDAEHRGQPTTRYGMPWSARALNIAPADAVAPTRAVLQAALEGRDFPDGVVGRMAVAVLVAAHLSHEAGGCEVDMAAEALPLDRVFAWA